MAVQVEIWVEDIVGNLFKDNQFLTKAVNHDQYVLGGAVVHVPQAGGLVNVSKNRGSLPAAVTTRTDTINTYALDNYTCDPILIPYIDTIQLSYDKRSSVMKESMDALRQVVADNALISWSSTTSNVQLTTGAATAAWTSGATGYRAAMKVVDFKKMQLLFDSQNIPQTGRYCVVSANQFSQLTDDLSITQYRDFSSYLDMGTGRVGKLYGFDVFMRSSVLTCDNGEINGNTTPAVKAYGAATAADDNDAALFWHEGAVTRALGTVKFFGQENSPTYYGDLYSWLLMYGGMPYRADGKGVAILVSAPANAGN